MTYRVENHIHINMALVREVIIIAIIESRVNAKIFISPTSISTSGNGMMIQINILAITFFFE